MRTRAFERVHVHARTRSTCFVDPCLQLTQAQMLRVKTILNRKLPALTLASLLLHYLIPPIPWCTQLQAGGHEGHPQRSPPLDVFVQHVRRVRHGSRKAPAHLKTFGPGGAPLLLLQELFQLFDMRDRLVVSSDRVLLRARSLSLSLVLPPPDCTCSWNDRTFER